MARGDGGFLGFSTSAWIKIGIIGTLFAATFRYNLIRLWLKTNPFNGEPNWSHSMLVPVVGLYFLFVHREELLAADGQPFVWGRFLRPGRLYSGLIMAAVGAGIAAVSHGRAGNLFLLTESAGAAIAVLGLLAVLLDWSIGTTLFGLAVFVYGIYPGQNDYLKDIGMVATLFGIVLLVGGRQVMRIAWFPIVFLVCAIPWPGLVYSWVTEPLSQIAAWFAVKVLQVTGVDAVVNGTKIIMGTPGKEPRVLNVAEACAGLRSLMTYISVGAAIAFLSARPLWQKLAIVASTIPIAIACNLIRISGVGELDRINSNWTEGFAHQFVGLMMLIPAFLMILTVLWVLDRIFIEEADDTAGPGDGTGAAVKKAAPAILKKATPAIALPAAGAVPAGAVGAGVAAKAAVAAGAGSQPKAVAATSAAASSVAATSAAGTSQAGTPVAGTPTAGVPSPVSPVAGKMPVAPPVAPRAGVPVVTPTGPVPSPVARPAAAPVARSVPAAPTPAQAPTVKSPAQAPAAKVPGPAPAVAVPPRPAGIVPPRPAGIVPPRPAGVRPPGTPPVRPPGAPVATGAGAVAAGPGTAGPVTPPSAGPSAPAGVKPPAGLVPGATPGITPPRPPAVPPRPAGVRAVVPPRPPQQAVPPKPNQETP